MSAGESTSLALSLRMSEYVRYAELKAAAYAVASLQQKKMFHSLAILSLYPRDGKTHFTAALALAYADVCRANVLVVDATTYQNKDSLALQEVIPASHPFVRVRSVAQMQIKPATSGASPGSHIPGEPPVEAEIVHPDEAPKPPLPDNDFSLLQDVMKQSKPYGLVLLDTAAMTAKNKNNIDPCLIARLCDSSLLLVGPPTLSAPDVTRSLTVLHDPSIHLLGLIDNAGDRA